MRAPVGTPLYVHLPYCVVKCHYCDFYSAVVDAPDVERLVDNLLREAEQRASESPRTVFLGGGTPTLLSEPELARLLDGLDDLTGFRSSACEVTVECNPESLDASKAACLIAGGATRLSIGVQSLRQEALELFGRPHDVQHGLDAIAAARAGGAEWLSVDLIYSWPGQRPEQWAEDLGRILELGPNHVSAYNLAWEEGTPFRRWLESGRLRALPEELEIQLFRSTREQLVGAGFFPYEISNFSPSGSECRHNQNYWRNGPYLGLGPSAVSKIGFRRFGNVRSVERWGTAIEAGALAEEWSEEPPPRSRLGETWWLGLRTAEGVDPAEARRVAGFADAQDPTLPIASAWVEQGHLIQAGDRLQLTEMGLLLADTIAASFLAEPAEIPTGPGNTVGSDGARA